MSGVRKLWAIAQEGGKLYSELQRILHLPPLASLRDVDEVANWRRRLWPRKEWPYRAPEVWYSLEGNAVRFVANDRQTEVMVQFDPDTTDEVLLVEVTFNPPSVVIAGQLIARLRARRWDGVFVCEAGYNLPVELYNGPMHPELMRVKWDVEWVMEHPEYQRLHEAFVQGVVMQ